MSLIACAAAVFAIAQDPNELRIRQADSLVASQPTLYVTVVGTETLGNTTTQVSTDAYWFTGQLNGKLLAELEILHYRNNQLVARIVGDGDTVWSYDLVRAQYSGTRYGGYLSTRPTNYIRDLLYEADATTKGQSAYLTRFLREVYSGGGSTYHSWMPGVIPTDLPQGSNADPVNPNVSYPGTPTTDYVLYNGAPRRSVAFELQDDPPNSDRALATITFNDVAKMGSNTLLSSWVLTPYTGFSFAQANFRPYTASQIQGWRPITGPRPPKG